jgi:hypothetical protein
MHGELSASPPPCPRPGAIDEFFIEAPDLGQLLAIDIGHDNRGVGAGWHLNKVRLFLCQCDKHSSGHRSMHP